MGMSIEGVSVYPLKKIDTLKGAVWHGLKATDDGYSAFGEAYFSEIHPTEIKGWKKHLQATLNLIVVKGEIEFVIYDDRENSATNGAFYSVILSADDAENYKRLTVRSGLWMAFRCVSPTTAMLLDIIDMVHTDNESIKAGLDEINYNWVEQ